VSSLPNNWQTISLRYISECLDGKRIPLNSEERGLRQGEYPYWGANSIVDYVDEYLFDESLVLLGEDGAPFFDKTKPVAFLVNEKVWINNHIHVLRIKNGFDSKFVVYSLNATDYGQWINGSTRDKLTQENMGSIKIDFPPLPEQRAIADHLDSETARIDSLIAAKERLLELLAEKRSAIINQVVTKGLNSDVKMKDSGVAWLGYMPSHWEVKRLKHISPSQSVGLVINPSSYVTDVGVPFLYGGDISEGHISIENARRISPENSKLLEQSMLRTGDLVMVRVGYPGITAVVPEYLDGSNCASMMIVRRHPSFISDWLCYVMNSRASRAQVESVQYGAAQKQFNISHAVEFVYPLPPIEEQEQIVKYLDHQTKRLTNLATKIKTAIDLLHERRVSLIAAAVSGQIKVV
jgi:type I restriction enzyme S subunit